MKIALISPRYLAEDMRGGEEAVRLLFDSLKKDHAVSVLTSNAIDIRAEHSLLGRKFKFSAKMNSKDGVLMFKSKSIVSQVLYFLQYPANLLERKGFPAYNIQVLDIIRTYGWGPYIPDMIDVLSTENFDVVHASIYPTNTAWIAFRFAQKSKTPFVFTPYFHYLKNEFRDSICLREMLKKSSVVVACSNMEREKLIEMGSDPSRTFVIPLSINSEILPNDWFDKSFNRSMLGITGEFVIVTYPWTGKGGDLVLRTAMTVSQDIKGISVVTIGEPDRVYSAIREKANRTAPNLQILDMGWLTGEQKWRAISSGDVFALPSSSDAFGMSYLDAWTASIPIVVLKGTPQEEMVRDKIDGFAIRHDAKELENVLRMLLMDMGMCQQAGNEGRRRVREEFSPAKMVSRYVDVYHLAMR